MDNIKKTIELNYKKFKVKYRWQMIKKVKGKGKKKKGQHNY